MKNEKKILNDFYNYVMDEHNGILHEYQIEMFLESQKEKLQQPDVMRECFRSGYEQGYKDCQQMDNTEEEAYKEWERKHYT